MIDKNGIKSVKPSLCSSFVFCHNDILIFDLTMTLLYRNHFPEGIDFTKKLLAIPNFSLSFGKSISLFLK